MVQKKKRDFFDITEEQTNLPGEMDAAEGAPQEEPCVYSLEEILSEFGTKAAPCFEPTQPPEQASSAEAELPVAMETAKAADGKRKKPTRLQPPAQWEPEETECAAESILPPPPQPVTMEEVVRGTVDSVLEEECRPPKRFLFSRRRAQDTEQLYASEPEPEPEIPEAPELPLEDAAADYRALRARRKRPILAAALIALLLCALAGVEYSGLTLPYWTGELRLQSGVLFGGLLLITLLGLDVFRRALCGLAKRRCTPELMISLSCIVSLLDCASRPFLSERCDASPFAAVAAAAMVFAMWGGSLSARGLYDSYRSAAVNENPPYLVTDTADGACKQRGRVQGFYNQAESESVFSRQMALFLPVILIASVVFALLSSVGQGKAQNYLWCQSAILSAAASLVLPLAYTLPFAKLSRRLLKSGGAVAGTSGAERISRKQAMILTDSDLFPPGTITLNGMKVFGETLSKVLSYAATLAQASGSGLFRLFEELLKSEGGALENFDDFSFFEEGGVSATIHGEAAILGTASFMRKMEIRMPGGLKLKTGVFLAVDRQLIAVFAVKYLASENVEWALRAMRRNRITPILAVRDGNLVPGLLKRKFGTDARAVYPTLAARVALSEQEGGQGRPDALLYREGLMPYVEAVAGSRRYSRAARANTNLALLGSMSGTLLSFYLSFQCASTLLTPLALLAFLLLWSVPTFLLSGLVNRF